MQRNIRKELSAAKLLAAPMEVFQTLEKLLHCAGEEGSSDQHLRIHVLIDNPNQ